MKKTKTFLTLLFLGVLTVQAQTEKLPHKFGSPTNEELTMTQYEAAPEAPAVILCETTDTRFEIFNGDFSIVTEVKRCVKILKEEGKDHANIELVYYSGNKSGGYKDNITSIKATTYNIVNGKVEKTKMGSNLIFREQLDETHQVIKFSIPKVEVGTVFEYQYEKRSENPYYIDTWYAQHSIPTDYCRYVLKIPEYFRFNINQTGHEVSRMQQTRKSITFSLFFSGQKLDCDGTEYTFIGRQLSALKDDPFIWSLSDVCNKVKAEFHSFVIPGFVNKQYTTTWENINELLMDDDDFGGKVKRKNPLKKEMEDANIYKIADTQERMMACFRLLNQKFRWNGDYRLYGSNMREIEKNSGGSNADLNFILINMLRDTDLDAFPILLSTRDNGMIPLTYPTLNAFNTFIVGVAANDSTIHLLDASARYGAINVLPSKLLSGQARIVGSKKHPHGGWIDLLANANGRTLMHLNGTLAEDGTLTAHLQSKYMGNDVLLKRKAFKEKEDSAAYVEKIGNNLNASITKYQIEEKEENSSQLTEEIDLRKGNDVTSDHIYLHLSSLMPLSESPFQAETRSLPIEFPYMHSLSMVITIELPEGYAVEELPKPALINYQEKDITYSTRYEQRGSLLSIQCRFAIKRLFFLPDEYTDLKETFDLIANQANSTIVIKKAK